MPREAGPSLNERQFLVKALAEGIRLDGRSFDQYRNLQLEFGEEYGVTDVMLGKTRIRTHATASLSPPNPTAPFTGLLTLHLTLSPLCSPSFSEPSSRLAHETHILHTLDVLFRRSSALDLESLCILSGLKVWAVRCDIHVLSLDGNILDAAAIGVLSALASFRREDVEVRGEEVIVYSRREREPIPLAMLHWPICVGFSFFELKNGAKGKEEEGETVALVDASGLEETCRAGSCTVGMNRHGEVVHIGKLGGKPVDAVKLLQCVNVAREKVREIAGFVERRLKEDADTRNKGGLIAELRAENER